MIQLVSPRRPGARRRALLVAVGCGVLVSSSACTTTRVLDFSVVSTYSVQLEGNDELRRGKGRVKSEIVARKIFWIPDGEIHAQEAIGMALELEPGCVALLDGSITRRKQVFIPYIWEVKRMVVEGTPLIDSSRLSQPEIPQPRIAQPEISQP